MLSECFLAYYLTETMPRDGQVQIWGEKFFASFGSDIFDILERYVQGVMFEITNPAELKLAQKVQIIYWSVWSVLVYNT